MSENSINPISHVQPAAIGGMPPKPQVVKTAVEEVSDSDKPPQQQTEHEPAPASSASNVSVHFRVNDDTHELTVFVVDRENKKILRTIPASEFSKLNAGDILQLTA
ncbi:MAG TPA: flagellar protein FlaG [Anaerolineales bacterium]|nr:flagellar protein FlaG [Anaerolineales bacterium]